MGEGHRIVYGVAGSGKTVLFDRPHPTAGGAVSTTAGTGAVFQRLAGHLSPAESE